MKELTPSSRQLFYMLLSKHKSFSKKGRLAEDGSFYYADKRLAEELYLSEKTIQRSKKRLVQCGYIKVEVGRHKGWATKYWIVPKVDKMSAFNAAGKMDILSAKDDELSFRAGQNVDPNKSTIKEENKRGGEKENRDLQNLNEEQKEGIRAGVSFWGCKEKTIEFFLREGYEGHILEGVLEDVG